jgi:CubicO group peptidase (beta-lactamase class C family)
MILIRHGCFFESNAYEDKLERMELDAIFEEAAMRRVFPGGVVFCRRGEQITYHHAFGTTAYDAEYSRPVQRDTIYDFASVSKMFTLTAFLIAKREAGISENEPVARFLPSFEREDKRAITLKHLMRHNAGFEFHLQRLYGQPCETWIEKIAEAPLECAPDTKVNYTCTAYFLLARVIEKLTGQGADEFITREILGAMDLHWTGFKPFEMTIHYKNSWRSPTIETIAPTELKEDGTPYHGIVHDEAARQWQEETGGYCGNAGVFGTAKDLARFCGMWLNNGEEILHPDDVKAAFDDTVLENAEGSVYRGWGWQCGNKTYLGEYAPEGCCGHQGFTGPTFFINPRTQDTVIVLNNRVYPTRNGPARFLYHRKVANAHFAKTED